jgi:ketosteroid isomerase-like protein
MNDQAASEEEIVRLSTDKFRWKTTADIDRVEDLFDDDLIFVHLNGHVTSKAEWIGQMRSGRFVYKRIQPHAMSARVYGEAAVLFGKATFDVSMGGFAGSFNLVFTEVYVRKAGVWKLVNLHTCSY